MNRALATLATIVAAGTLATSAAAQPAGRDKLAAQALFDQGQALMDAGKLAEACPKLAESYRLDPAGGAILNLARCHQLEGRTATAWQEFKTALATARADGRADRERFALEQIAELEPNLSRLTVAVRDGLSIEGLEVVRDGTSLGPAALGTPLAIDPGPHVVEVRAPGRVTFKAQITVGVKDDQTLDVPKLLVAPPPPRPPAPPRTQGLGRAQRIGGFVVVGVGGASLVAGTLTGALAISKRRSSDDLCNTALCPDTAEGREAVSLNEQAKRLALSTDVLFGVGIGLVGAGLAISLTAPSGASARTSLQVGPGSIGVAGAF